MAARADKKPRRRARSATEAREARALAARVRELRVDRHLTLEQAAERMGLDLTHLQKIESGHLNVSLATLTKIAEGLGVELVIPISRASVPTVPARAAADTYPRANPSRAPSEGGREPAARTPAVQPDEVVRAIGRRVSELRLAKGLTQAQLAEALGEALTYVQRLESGRQKLVSVREMVRVAQALDATVAELLAEPALPRRGRGRPLRRSFES